MADTRPERRFTRIDRLPPYVFNITAELKMAARRRGEDIIDFSMGNPDGATPPHIVEKLCTVAQRPDTHGYSTSRGIPRLRREKMIAENFRSLGMALVETGMAWFWPDSRVRKWFDVEGLDNLKRAQMQNRGVMVVGVHFMSLELGGRVMGLCQPMMATYRPHNNQLMEWVQTRGRMRSNKAMIGRNNLRGIVSALKKGEAVWFAPDQDYGRKGSSFAPFFAVENVATTNGTYVLSRLSGAAMLTVTMVRKADYSGYRLYITPEMEGYPTDENQAAAYMNKIIEKEIMRAPEQYLWIHRRFKTRPVGESSLYI